MAKISPEQVGDRRFLPVLKRFGDWVTPEAIQRAQVGLSEPYASATDVIDRLGQEAAGSVEKGRLPKSRLSKGQKREIMARHGLTGR